MHICFLAPANSIHTVRWVNSLVERNHKLTLLTMHPPAEHKIDSRIQIIVLPFKAPLGYYLNVLKAKKVISELKPDILNTHYASGYGTLSRFLNYKPTLLSVWGSDVYDFPYESPSKRKILIKNLKVADRLASTSQVMKKQTEQFCPKEMKIEVTPFGVDMNRFKPNKDGKNDTKITIGMIKALESKYGPEYLIEGVHLLLNRLKEEYKYEVADQIKLLVVGKGSRLHELQKLVKDYHMEDIVTFTGAVPHTEVPSYLNKIDIYCAPSTLDSESFGVAIVEASASGIPVIVSNVGGLPEVVKDQETGFVVKPKNAKEISEKLYELVMDKEKRERFGEQGRIYTQSLYDWEKNVTVMESIYKDMTS
ncbi:glycosyltransferase [Bacillus sp. REN16]|uniref:glycosyltransferase n=1 Tax=Bacillus sp. REN16 TaxID=2887296 RepID=UPI001E60C4F2|nr:glycosyltransferase [Bacillus sp. REN16]MCC3356921.1 glycosyltransferase [Bacillus sp. REN16]